MGALGVKLMIGSLGWAVAAIGGYTFPAAMLAVAVASLLLAFFSQRRQARTDLTTMLYRRIEDLERQLARAEGLLREAHEQIKTAREENIQLMRQLVAESRRRESQ